MGEVVVSMSKTGSPIYTQRIWGLREKILRPDHVHEPED